MSKRRLAIRQPFVNPGKTLKPAHGRTKPAKPHDEFPLFPHNNGQWAKKIRGRLHYFGPWTDTGSGVGDTSHGADAALAKYLQEKDDLHAGRTPRPDPAAATIKDIANAFLNHKEALLAAGELSPHTWTKYKEVAELVVSSFGKQRLVSDLRAEDFTTLKTTMTKRWGPLRVADFIQHVRSVFKHAFDAELIDRPVRFGPGFDRPSRKTIRVHRAEQGPKLFTADEVHRMLGAAGVSLKAMLLLGINCGFGNADCARLPLSVLDLDGAWLDYPRPKTGVGRRCPLWPETIAALRDVLAARHKPSDARDAGLVFITKYGGNWDADTTDRPITKETRKLLLRLGIAGHRNFYTLRHTFRTIADEAKDQPAADHIMGHQTSHISAVYRERISDARLLAVTDHVRTWLFPDPVQ